MKLFSSTPYSYSNLTYVRGFGSAPRQVSESKFNQLQTHCLAALAKEDAGSALKFAGKSAIEYGVAGLILYIDAYTEILTKALRANEIIEQELIHVLGYLQFARKLVLNKKEQRALLSMDTVYDGEDYQLAPYWDAREEKLYRLSDNLEEIKSEADVLSNALLEECIQEAKDQAPSASV
ncbi:MAG: hypothetical protein WC785_07850 [Tatlockia sp.]|jgi:hypothetical protein